MGEAPYFESARIAGDVPGEPVLIKTLQAIEVEFRRVPSHKRKSSERKHLRRMTDLAARVQGLEFYPEAVDANHTSYSLVCGDCSTPVSELPLNPIASVVCSGCGRPFGRKDHIQAMGAWLDVESKRQKRA